MNTYLTTKQKDCCSGCRACEQICPQKCIEMYSDDEGFIYPNIIEEKCLNCGMCKTVCPINKDTTFGLNLEKPIVYAAWHKDSEVLKKSSSGGIFSALAKCVLDKNGIVFGCSLDENFVANHIWVDNESNLYKLRGSKYVQSNTGDTYTKVKHLLKEGKYVLYTGTPCQIAGLKSFLRHKYDKLITVDLICHGVPSPKVFLAYIEYLEDKHKGKVIDFKFRDKSKNGWSHTFLFKIYRNNRYLTRRSSGYLSSYYYAFLNNMLQRPICYQCPYTTTKREGDITLADFWGIEKINPKIDASKGVSLVIINTKKGENVFKNSYKQIYKVISTLENAKSQNHNLEKPSSKPEIRDTIYKEIDNLGFEKVAKKYFTPNNFVVVKIKSLIPMKLKRKIKRILSR